VKVGSGSDGDCLQVGGVCATAVLFRPFEQCVCVGVAWCPGVEQTLGDGYWTEQAVIDLGVVTNAFER
jgi:hypothetical protein